MKRTEICLVKDDYPEIFHKLLEDSKVYDSSCSKAARVIFIDKDTGYYLKCADKGSLKKEALMTEYFYQKGLAARVLDYLSDDKDWLLTERVIGEDCTYAEYLSDPKRLCDTIATRLRELHELDPSGCPVDHTSEYLATIDYNYRSGNYDTSLFPDNWGYASAEEAIKVIEGNRHLFKTDTLIHGDYCLPNIMLNDWSFSGFIDLGNGGVGDRHVDLFWGAWTLFFNLKTDEYRERFFDAYGRDKIDVDMLRVVAAAEVFG
jgi:kanamycin kinase